MAKIELKISLELESAFIRFEKNLMMIDGKMKVIPEDVRKNLHLELSNIINGVFRDFNDEQLVLVFDQIKSSYPMLKFAAKGIM